MGSKLLGSNLWMMGIMVMRIVLTALLALLLVEPAAADVTRAAPDNIELSFKVSVKAAPAEAYAAVTRIGQWWSSAHSYSGDAKAHMTLEAKAGGCWCETLKDGGSVQHMRVLLAIPGSALRLSGGLGPLQEQPVMAVMSWSFEAAKAGGTEIAMVYRIAGPLPEGVNWAAAVNGVLGEQTARLKRYIETGDADAKAKP